MIRSEFEEQSFKFQSHGAIFNKNKIEDFKTCDKIALINTEGQLIWDDVVSGRCLHTPSLFTRFIVLSFAVSSFPPQQPRFHWYQFLFQDLKSFNYYYWFAYPCPSEPIIEQSNEHKAITAELPSAQLLQLHDIYFRLSNELRSFFLLKRNGDDLEYFKLADKIDAQRKEDNFANEQPDEFYFCFSDPCTDNENAAWPLRLFLLTLTHLWYMLTHFRCKLL